MNTKTIRVADATNLQLNGLVAKCEGAKDICFRGGYWIVTDTNGGWEYLGNLNSPEQVAETPPHSGNRVTSKLGETVEVPEELE